MFFSRVLFHGTLDKQLVSLSKVTCVSTDFTASHIIYENELKNKDALLRVLYMCLDDKFYLIHVSSLS